MKKRGIAVTIIFILFVFFILFLMGFASAWSDNGSLIQEVDGCNLLNTTNATYTLNQSMNSSGMCFNITAQNITLDCDNNIINYSTGGGANTFGIYSNQNFTTIRNCNISDGNWGSAETTRQGIYLESSNNNILLNNYITTNNSNSVYLWNVNFSNLTLNTAISNRYEAFYIEDSFNNDLFFNTGISNPSKDPLTNYCRGFYLESSSNNNLVSNTGKGWGSDTLSGNSDGFFLYLSNNLTLTNNTGISTRDGIFLHSSSNSILINNTGTSEASVSIYLYRSANNTLINNTGTSNRTTSTGSNIAYGIYIGYSSDNNILISDTGISYDGRGIAILFSSNNTLIKSTAISYNSTSLSRSALFLVQANYTNVSDCVNISGIITDVYFYELVGSVGNILTNCSYNTSKEIVNGSGAGSGNSLIRKWYYQTYVTYSNSTEASGVNITAYNSSDVVQFTAQTNASGWIQRQEVIEYNNTGGTRSYYNNYTINAKKSGTNNATNTFNFTSLQSNILDYITLVIPTVVSTTGSGWRILASTNYTANSTFSSSGESFNLKIFNNIKFKINQSSPHILTLKQFNSTFAKVLIQSDTITAYLEKGVLNKFDLNGDSIEDIAVRYDGIANLKAVIFLQEIVPAAKSNPYVDDSQNVLTSTNITNEQKPEEQEKGMLGLYIGILVFIVIITIFLFFILHKRHKRR